MEIARIKLGLFPLFQRTGRKITFWGWKFEFNSIVIQYQFSLVLHNHCLFLKVTPMILCVHFYQNSLSVVIRYFCFSSEKAYTEIVFYFNAIFHWNIFSLERDGFIRRLRTHRNTGKQEKDCYSNKKMKLKCHCSHYLMFFRQSSGYYLM